MRKQYRNLIFLLIFAVVGGLATFFVSKALGGTETYTSANRNNNSVYALLCKSNNVENAFFTTDGAKAYHEIRITYEDDKSGKIFYQYRSEFTSAEKAEKATDFLHAKYNIYVGKNDQNSNNLDSTFTHIDTIAQVNLYANTEDLTSFTGDFFFLSSDGVTKTKTGSAQDVMSYYTDHNFNCSFNK